MTYRFVMTTKNRMAIAKANNILCLVDEMSGYDDLKMLIVDDIVDNLSNTLVEKGIEVPVKAAVIPRRRNNISISSIVISIVVVILWLMGIVVAKGFWLTLLSIVIPPYALYLTVELFMHLGNLIT